VPSRKKSDAYANRQRCSRSSSGRCGRQPRSPQTMATPDRHHGGTSAANRRGACDVPAAAGDAPGTLIFSSAQDTTNHVIRPNEEANNTIEVDVIKIDSLVHYSPALMKIDVEGFESRVLIGAENILKSVALKAIIIELSNTVEYGFNDTYTHHLLTLNGFSPFSYDPFTRKLTAIAELASDNIIYCRDVNFVVSRIKNAGPIKIMGEKI